MEVKTTKREVITSIIVTFNEDDIKRIKKLVALNPCSDQGLFLKTILEKAEMPANVPTAKEHMSFWYVTVCGTNHTLADAVGTIRTKLPDLRYGIMSPGNWFSEREICVGMWHERDAKIIQKLLSNNGFECSIIKVGDSC